MDALTYIALVLVLGIAAQWLAWRFSLPSILLLLLFGFGLSYFTGSRIDDFIESEETLLSIVGLFVAIILFEGGLTLKFSELREAGAPVVRLCSLGAIIALGLISFLAAWVFGWDWRVASLLGAVLVVTGPTVVGPLLRLIKPSRKIASIVKWEGIVIDPIGAILAILIFQVAISSNVGDAGISVVKALGLTILAGFGIGIPIAKGLEYLLKHHHIPDFLESIFLLAIVSASFAISNLIQDEAGLLTVTILGIALANQKSVSVKRILEFKEHLRVLIIAMLFIFLSGRVSLDDVAPLIKPGLIFLAALIFLVRPISVFLSNLGSKKVTLKEQLFLSSLAPRGIVAAAVSSVIALELEHAASAGKLSHEIAEQAHQLVPVTFLTIIGTVFIYGIFASPLANALKLASKNARGVLFAGADSWTRKLAKALYEDGHQVFLLDTKYEKVASAKMEGLPALRANILSEYVGEELDLGGLGQLISATPNDEINSLASQEFAHLFSRANVWQVTPVDSDVHHTKAVAAHQRARLCFHKSPSFNTLEELSQHGGFIKKTTITEVFTVEDFYKTHGSNAYILFLYDKDKGLRPAPNELEKAVPGTVLYALVPQKESEPDAGSLPIMGL